MAGSQLNRIISLAVKYRPFTDPFHKVNIVVSNHTPIETGGAGGLQRSPDFY